MEYEIARNLAVRFFYTLKLGKYNLVFAVVININIKIILISILVNNIFVVSTFVE